MRTQMTRLVAAGALALLAAVLPSCKKGCYDCSCQAYGTTEVYPICREDYDNQAQFIGAMQQFENGGVYGECVCIKQ
ncbi:hypothetical protein [Flavobacterium sp.]|uniref:hypothetical protein n=1 Tax=Flavobacterium sp. TaxID=239 RepID=UPI0040334E59